MKKIASIFVIILVIASIIFLIFFSMNETGPIASIDGNLEKKALAIKLNHTHDIHCAMVIKTLDNAAQAISPGGKTWFFDDPGCMILWLKESSFEKDATLWIHTLDTHRWIDAKKAYYSQTDKTKMNYGFGAREIKNSDTIPYEEMRLRMLRGEHLQNPKIRKKLLEK